MSNKRTPARRSHAVSATFGHSTSPYGFGSPSAFNSAAASQLSYISEPPDLSAVSDPPTVVLLKLLSKNDETTKSKALEELQTKVASLSEVEEPLLVAWIRLYPRLSTDVSIIVRRLAHNFHGIVSQRCGRKIARHMPKVIGPWLAGIYDNDRGSARAAAEALKAVFTTQEKISNVWKAYQSAILEYCTNVVTNETVNSLSDERQVSPGEAEAKFARVIATSVRTVGHLISELPPSKVEESIEGYVELFRRPRVWDFAYHADPYLRRSIYELLQISLSKRKDFILPNLEVIANALLIKSLALSQIGSVSELLGVVLDLTGKFPEAWTVIKPPKKRPPISLVVRFIKRGSQGGSPDYWFKVSKLVTILPREVLPADINGVKDLLTSVLDGIRNGPEPRSSLTAAWAAYFKLCYHILAVTADNCLDEVASYIYKDAIYPVLEGYLLNKWGTPQFEIPYFGPGICAAGIVMAGSQNDERIVNLISQEVWKKLELLTLGHISGIFGGGGVAPSDHQSMKDCGQRWVELSSEIFSKADNRHPIVGFVKESNAEVLILVVDLIVKSNGENTGAATLLGQILLRLGPMILGVGKVKKPIASFFTDNLPGLLSSPSLNQLLSALVAYGVGIGADRSFRKAWERTVHSLILAPLEGEKKEAGVILLLKSTPAALHGKLPLVPELDSYVVSELQVSLKTDKNAGWEIVKSAIYSPGALVSEDTVMNIFTGLTDSLSFDENDRTSRVLMQMASVAEQDPAMLASFAYSSKGTALLSKLLVLMGSWDANISDAAGELSRALEKELSTKSSDQIAQTTRTLLDIISENVMKPVGADISTQYLAMRARDLISRFPKDEQASLCEGVLFGEGQWKAALAPFLDRVPKASLAISNPIGGSVFLVQNPSAGTTVLAPVVRDQDGVSSVLRMAMFTVEFLKAMGVFDWSKDPAVNIFGMISRDARTNVLMYLMLVSVLANDDVTITGSNDLWSDYYPAAEAEVLEFVFETQQFFSRCLKETPRGNTQASDGSPEYISRLLDRLMEASKSETPGGFHSARVLAAMISELSENKNIPSKISQGWLNLIDAKKGSGVFRSTAILVGLAESLEHSSAIERLRNLLASDLVGVPASEASEQGLRKLLLLNAVLPKPGQVDLPLPQQRAIFLIKHLLGWFQDEAFAAEPDYYVIAEATKVISSVVPVVKELYGEHWTLLCHHVLNCWMMCMDIEERDLPIIFSSLKLSQLLNSLHTANEDFEDAWNAEVPTLHTKLFDLLPPDEQDQPRNLCNSLLARQVKGIDLVRAGSRVGNPEEIYSLLNVQSRPIQEAAFKILHRYIPSAQEELSVEAAVSKDENFELQLPIELLSLVMGPPEVGDPSVFGSTWDRLGLRGYLLTWILIFDHFEKSSFKVRSAYVESLKEGGYLSSFLDFAFDFLGHSKGKPIAASKFSFEHYDLSAEADPIKDAQWLLIHIYYLSLRHTPSLAKRWWTECKVRQKVLSVEEFTEKYLSPVIIEQELQSVQSWIQQQQQQASSSQDEADEMQVKITRGLTKEVTAIYPIDDQTMEMLVRLPPTFPLRQVEVEGTKRIGLSERDFRKMQLASQAVINFQSASIIDGLMLFRKNVALKFQGVAECAICYSILAVTPDRALPNKACGTCKNKFHTACLYRWFKTSNASSCPLCRTMFSMY